MSVAECVGPRLFEHQEITLAFHLSRLNSLDLSEVGVGKTPSVILCVQKLVSEQKIQKILVICPNSILDNWSAELQRWSSLTHVLLRGSKEKRIELLQKEANIYLINFEGVRIIFPWLNKPWDIIIADEVHHIKSYKAEQTKKILELAKKARARKALTGTLVTNDIEDVWSIAQFVDPKIFQTNYWGFRNHFMFNTNAGKPWMNFPDWRAKPGAAEEIKERLAPHAIRFEKREVMKWLPPVLFQKRYVELGEEQYKVYHELRRHFVTELEGEPFAALQILERINKLLQVTDGFCYRDERPFHFKENAKLKELKEIIEEIGPNRCVVWACYREDVTLIQSILPANLTRCITGYTPAEERQGIIDSFNGGKIRYLIANPSCAGEGISLYAPYFIYFSRGWRLGDRIQSLGRGDRPGSEQFENICVIDIIVSSTVDQKVMDSLESKENLLHSLNPQRTKEIFQ